MDALAERILSGRENLNSEPQAEVIAFVLAIPAQLDPSFAAAAFRYARDAHFLKRDDISLEGLRRAFRR